MFRLAGRLESALSGLPCCTTISMTSGHSGVTIQVSMHSSISQTLNEEFHSGRFQSILNASQTFPSGFPKDSWKMIFTIWWAMTFLCDRLKVSLYVLPFEWTNSHKKYKHTLFEAHEPRSKLSIQLLSASLVSLLGSDYRRHNGAGSVSDRCVQASENGANISLLPHHLPPHGEDAHSGGGQRNTQCHCRQGEECSTCWTSSEVIVLSLNGVPCLYVEALWQVKCCTSKHRALIPCSVRLLLLLCESKMMGIIDNDTAIRVLLIKASIWI